MPKYKIRDMSEPSEPIIRYVTLQEILEEINRDRSEEWTDYDETDWEEGLQEWTDWELLDK